MKKILIPCDFSDTTESAIQYAIELAKSQKADLVLLHVEMIPVVSPEIGIAPYAMGDMKEDSLNALKNLADKIRITESFEGKIDYFSEMGHTPDVISEHVSKLHVDLVVMGISGHGSGFMQSLVGSASVEVSKQISASLIIVPPDAVFKPLKNLAFACSYDPGLILSTSLSKVRKMASEFQATLSVVHVVPEQHRMTEEERSIDSYIERKLEKSQHRTFIVREQNAAAGILNFIKEHEIDMLVIEPKKHSFFHKLFSGSVTNQLAFNSPVPLLAVHGEVIGEA